MADYSKLPEITASDEKPKVSTFASKLKPSVGHKETGDDENAQLVEASVPETYITQVNVDGLALLKLIRHAHEVHQTASGPGSHGEQVPAVGQLTGIELDGQLEVSNSFGLASGSLAAAAGPENGEEAAAGRATLASAQEYTERMLVHLKEVNSDASVVGFYASTNGNQTLGLTGFIQTLIASQQTGQGIAQPVQKKTDYQDIINKSGRGIALVYDVSSAAQGYVDLKAFRLSRTFMDIVHNANSRFDANAFAEHNLDPKDILEPVPVFVKKSVLLNAYMAKAASPIKTAASTQSAFAPRPAQLDAAAGFAPLGLSLSHAALALGAQQSASLSSSSRASQAPVQSQSSLSAPVGSLISALENHANHLSSVLFQSRQLARERTRVESLPNVVRRREENAARAQKGLELLPPTFEELSLKEPSRLDTVRTLLAVDGATESLENATTAALVRGFAARTAFNCT